MPPEKKLPVEVTDPNKASDNKYDIKVKDIQEKKDSEADDDVPTYKTKIELSDTQINKLRKEVFKHWELLKESRDSKKLEKKWEALDAQYDGEVEVTFNQEFNMNLPITKIKVDNIVIAGVKSFLESDPMFSVHVRPEAMRQGREYVADRQSEYLDYLFDEDIHIESPLKQVLHCSTLKDVGILKTVYEYTRKPRKREEFYSGKYTIDPKTQQMDHPGLKAFTTQYPGATDENNPLNKYVKRLLSGKDINIVVEYQECIYDNPRSTFVDIKNFWCDLDTEGYEGLCNANITVELIPMSWSELKKKEANNDFINVDEVKYSSPDDASKEKRDMVADYKMCKHDIIEVNYWFNPDEDNDDPNNEYKLVCWFSVVSKAFLGAIYYPYYGVECYYLPFYIKDKRPGFYKGGIAEDLTDSHLIQNALINFLLTGEWIKNTVTPIVREGSRVAEQFLHDRWTHGIPIEVDQNASSLDRDVTFLEKPSTNTQPMTELMLLMGRYDDDVTKVSSYKSGRESPSDPTAPATKVALLLKESGQGIEDYVRSWLPSFNKLGEIHLQLIYQMSTDGRRYKTNRQADVVTGGDIFETITRDEMVAKTTIQSQAMSFAFDQLAEKQGNLILFGQLRSDPAIAQNPEAVYTMLRALVKSWSPYWKNMVDKIVASPKQLQIMQLKTTMQAIGVYLQGLEANRQKGGQPQPALQDLMALVAQGQASLTPPPQKPGQPQGGQ